jgi:DNA-binding transcriptional LysR family regulator
MNQHVPKRRPGTVPSFFEGDLQQLRCFYYAATYRSFTRAAERLSTGQPTVSTRIKQLERLLGLALFRRGRRGVTLTEEGRILLELVAPIVEGADGLAAELRERTGAELGQEVRLAAGQELLLHLAGPVLQAYRRRHPALRLVVFSRVRDQVFAMVEGDEVDFGIAGRAGVPGGLAFEEALADELVLIAPRRHELAAGGAAGLRDIARYPVLMPDRASSTRRLIEEAFRDQGLELTVAMELERWHVIKEFVALDQGIAIVPRFSVAGDERRLAIRPLSHRFPALSYGIVWRKGRHLSSLARGVIDALRGRTTQVN